MLFAAAVIIWIPIYFESAWWYLLSWIPGLFIMIVLDGIELPKLDLSWFDKNDDPIRPVVMVQECTPDREEAREPRIGELCAFWDDLDNGTYRIGTLESYKEDTNYPYRCKEHETNWKHAAPIEPIRYLK